MRYVRILGTVLVIVVVGGGGYLWSHRTQVFHNDLEAEVKLEQPELQQCKERLAKYFAAYKAYKADHKGAEPPSAENLFPKYMKDPTDLMCPTAVRWDKKGIKMDQGEITINRRKYPQTYGFLWMTSGYHRDLKLHGPEAFLMACSAHEEGLFRAAYKKRPPLGAFSGDVRKTWIPEVQAGRKLVLRANGKINEADPASE